MKIITTLFAVFALLACTAVQAQDAPPTPEQIAAYQAKIAELTKSLKLQDGSITIGNGLAQVQVPADLRYLSPEDADTVLVKLWGNPPTDEKTLGMLVPAGFSLTDEDSWGVIMTYEEDGYIKDDDAAKINYNDELKKMQENTRASSEQRVKEGYGAIELIGWAAPPRYDAAAKKMYWAKELKFDGGPENTLNYNIRILGRRGVLVLNAVAGMNQLADIEKATPTILGAVEFKEGNRYADFKPGTDKVASYGLAALVTGGVLAKTGLFAKIGLFVAKFAKLFIIGGVGLAALIGKLMGKKGDA